MENLLLLILFVSGFVILLNVHYLFSCQCHFALLLFVIHIVLYLWQLTRMQHLTLGDETLMVDGLHCFREEVIPTETHT